MSLWIQCSNHTQALLVNPTLCKKANKALNWIRKNLNKCENSVKVSYYLIIVRPLLEYASCMCLGSHQIYLIQDILKKSKGVLHDGSYQTVVPIEQCDSNAEFTWMAYIRHCVLTD